MASVTISRLLWLNDAADLSDALGLYVEIPTGDDTLDGEIVAYANGRRRIVVRDTDVMARQFALPVVEPDQLSWLRSKRGRLMLARDQSGLRLWGTFFALTPTPLPHRNAYRVEFPFESVTYDESV